MVRLSISCFVRNYNKKFVDKVRIYVRGGTGGNGLATLGGVGGHGGDVYLVGSADQDLTLYQFKQLHASKRFIADPGQNSQRRILSGLSGSNIYVQVPHGTTILDADSSKVLGEISTRKDKILVAKGGKGGSRWTNFIPRKGKAHSIILDLKLIADVGFVGFPNAGKSTLLRSLSSAKPKVAEYPFTTIKPELGTVRYQDFRKIRIADLPGLIEGAHLNKGRGHIFLKHIERTRLLLFVVDVTGFRLSSKFPCRDAFESVQLLTKELELYNNTLIEKPAILVLNKMDEDNANLLLEEFREKSANWKDHVKNLPPKAIPRLQMKFCDVIPISAKRGDGTSLLKFEIRKEIDKSGFVDNDQIKLEDGTNHYDLVKSSKHENNDDGQMLVL